MMFQQIADACFQIGTSEDTVTVSNIPFIWDGRSDRDMVGAYAVAEYIGVHKLSHGKPVSLLWVACREYNKYA